MAETSGQEPKPRLDAGQIAALRNLDAKRAGNDVDFVRIADARTLTDLGLAQRTAQGWVITPAGSAWLAARSL